MEGAGWYVGALLLWASIGMVGFLLHDLPIIGWVGTGLMVVGGGLFAIAVLCMFFQLIGAEK